MPPSADPTRAESLLTELRAELRGLRSTVVCFSGGIDSTLVLKVAHEQLGESAVGLTAVSPSVPQRDRQEAARIAGELGVRHHFIDSRELERPDYVANGPDRCFHCKTELYDIAERMRQTWQLQTIVNGTNADDLGDYRPGLRAAENAAVKSPLSTLGFHKADVRAVAQLVGLPSWNKPAAACLSSRIPYGSSVNPERLAQIESLEDGLLALGFRQVRVRWHDTIARIEVGAEEMARFADPALRDHIVAAGKRSGFAFVTLDLGGYRTGSHNEVLGARRLPVVAS